MCHINFLDLLIFHFIFIYYIINNNIIKIYKFYLITYNNKYNLFFIF